MEKAQYQLILKFPFEAIDDLEAREKAMDMLEDFELDKDVAKLQRVFKDKAPEKVTL